MFPPDERVAVAGASRRYTTDSATTDLEAALTRDGHVRLSGLVPDSLLARLGELARSGLEDAGGEYFHLKGSSILDSVLADWPGLSALDEVCARLTRRAAPSTPESQPYRVLRVIARPERRTEPRFEFHFDSYLLTAVIPIFVPYDSGALIMVPGLRPVRGSYLRHLLDRGLFTNVLACAFWASRWQRSPDKFLALTLTPGDVVLFWGYSSLHTSEPVHPGSARATVLCHYGQAHTGSATARLLRRRRRRP